MHTLFISDLHLAAERPHINQQFFDFLQQVAPASQALYILGDLFEYWAGDDDTDDPLNASVATALAQLAQQGVPVYMMHGNRDLLIGQAFAARARARLIADPTAIDLYGTHTLLMHGDSLCTDDVEYQKFRAYTHNPQSQAQFLQLPLAARHQQMRNFRAQSEASKSHKSAEIMDVSIATVEQTLHAHGHPRLIHGHTHRPAQHQHTVDGRLCERWVLGDWYQRGNFLCCDAAGIVAKQL
jgi:UDP-2,3-diacylglucosamine hydrolase